MRFEGVLSAWNHDAGYGAIRPDGGGDDVFVALGAFPSDGEGIRLGEALSFEIVSGRDGRKQAAKLKRLQRLPVAPRETPGARQRRLQAAQRKRRLGWMAGGAVVLVVLVLGSARWWPGAWGAGTVAVNLGR